MIPHIVHSYSDTWWPSGLLLSCRFIDQPLVNYYAREIEYWQASQQLPAVDMTAVLSDAAGGDAAQLVKGTSAYQEGKDVEESRENR